MVDFSKLPLIPVWGWPFALICPIYPFLIALVWLALYNQKKPSSYLFAFAIFGSAVFGILSLVYYPLKMYFQGFSWNDFGQIFWVAFYSAQGWYLLFRHKLKLQPAMLVGGFFVFSLAINFYFKTFGYLSLDKFTSTSKIALLFIGLMSTVAVVLISLREKKTTLF